MSSTISPDRILREMADLWVSLGKQSEGETSTGVLRSCTLTLVVVSEESDDPQEFGQTLAALMPEHPSRAIVIRLRPDAERWLSARVVAQCWMPFGQRTQICCEQIEISGAEASLPDLPAVVLPLIAPDLPVVVWCRSTRLFDMPEFSTLAGMANKIVLDSQAFRDPRETIQRLARMTLSGRALGDFAWTRLTRWRELIAQIFENREYLGRLPEVTGATIAVGGNGPAIPAWYLAAWLSDGLAAVGSRSTVRIDAEPAAKEGEIVRIGLTSPGEDGFQVSLESGEGAAVEVKVGALVNRMMFPRLNDYILMREELAIPERDALYERALAGAAHLALSTEGQ